MVSFMPRPLYPLDKRLGELQNQSGRCGEENILPPTWIPNSDPSAAQPVASRYTDYAIPAYLNLFIYGLFNET
jgi:hypothetical protein